MQIFLHISKKSCTFAVAKVYFDCYELKKY